MLRKLKDLEGYAIRALDGDIGHVKDFYFDDAQWVVRYLVVETGSWLSSRKVLVSPIAVGQIDHEGREIPVALTMEKVRNSPDIDTDRPVSRQQEMYYFLHYGYPQYWEGIGLWGDNMHPTMTMPEFTSTPVVVEPRPDHQDPLKAMVEPHTGDPHLRALNNLVGYALVASDGEAGQVRGLLVDEDSWAIRYLLADVSPGWDGPEVALPTASVVRVSWADSCVTVALTRQAVQASVLGEGDEVRIMQPR